MTTPAEREFRRLQWQTRCVDRRAWFRSRYQREKRYRSRQWQVQVRQRWERFGLFADVRETFAVTGMFGVFRERGLI